LHYFAKRKMCGIRTPRVEIFRQCFNIITTSNTFSNMVNIWYINLLLLFVWYSYLKCIKVNNSIFFYSFYQLKYLPLFHHFKAIYQFPKHIIFLVKIIDNASLSSENTNKNARKGNIYDYLYLNVALFCTYRS
jgi:hypothetical protein